MVGPSSSHTAGAVRIGLAARKLLGDPPVKAAITLSGSFSSTGAGHGTDRAIVAGLLNMEPDDMKIPESFREAEKAGLEFGFIHDTIGGAHPNTALLDILSASGRRIRMQASSLGGGRIMINKLDGVEINVTGERRKTLVAAVKAFVDAPAVYQNAPSFAYVIGDYTVSKTGTVSGPANEALMAALNAKGFIAE